MSRHMMQQEQFSGGLVYPNIAISGHCHSYSRTAPASVPEQRDQVPLTLTAIWEHSYTLPCHPHSSSSTT